MEQLIPNSTLEKIAAKLNERQIKRECPMCREGVFIIVDGYVIPVLQANTKNLKLSGKSLPTVAVMCKNCGYLMQFSLGALGLMVENKEEENVKSE